MHSLSSIPIDLSFIYNASGDKKKQYKKVFWLKTDFDSNIWDCDFSGNVEKKIDFNIMLSDGTQLTDQKHRILLNVIKYFLCIHTHIDATGGKILNASTVYRIVCRSLHMIDYFLLNQKYYQLHQHGFFSLTENDFTQMFLCIGSCRSIHKSIYRWKDFLTDFLKKKIANINQDIVDAAIEKNPQIQFCEYNNDEKILNLTDSELLRARVWLFINDYYVASRGKSGLVRTSPNNFKLAEMIYSNTLGGQYSNFPVLKELCIGKISYSLREYQSAPVCSTKNSAQMCESYFTQYYHTMRNLGILKTIDLPVPYKALHQIKFTRIAEQLNLNKTGRFSLLPSYVVLGSLKNAIEFCLNYGNDLIDSYLSLIKAVHDSGKTIMQWHFSGVDITPYLTPATINLGVKRWLIEKNVNKIRRRLENADHYRSLRENVALWELLRVLYGAIQIIVGTLMARRQGELIDLIATDCLDDQNRHLVFYARKTGFIGKREKIARPIPAIAAQMISLLERLQIELKNSGIIDKFYPLFSHPNPFKNKLVDFGRSQFDRSTDIFCDYMQTPLDKEGRRYYIRQHQLRRFFAMLFFWGSSFGGMDTLRWFLAHTNVEHLYHYITESTPGDVLRGVKAHYATEQLQSYDEIATALSNLLEKKFGTRKFDLMCSDELDDYIKNLIDEGSVHIEPEFFNTGDGNSYRILIKVTEKP